MSVYVWGNSIERDYTFSLGNRIKKGIFSETNQTGFPSVLIVLKKPRMSYLKFTEDLLLAKLNMFLCGHLQFVKQISYKNSQA